MENISLKIQAYLGKEFNDDEVKIQDDGSGPYISFWSDSLAKSKPTDDQLNALSSEATKIKDDKLVIINRKKSYGSWNDQLDEIYHDIDAWKVRIKSIKDANPKS
jgi:hypothetical protein